MFQVETIDQNPAIEQATEEIMRRSWPPFIHFGKPPADYFYQPAFSSLFEHWPELQFCIVSAENGRPVAAGNCLPVEWNKPFEELPCCGWDWAMCNGIVSASRSRHPVLCASAASIDPEYQGRGISRLIVSEMLSIARLHGMKHLIAPVRPSLKHMYDLEDIFSYMNRRTENNEPFDPWVRTHARQGAKIVCHCPLSMVIGGSVDEWAEWSNCTFTTSGYHSIEGALNRVQIDLEAGKGLYIEPNVWMVHEVEGL